MRKTAVTVIILTLILLMAACTADTQAPAEPIPPSAEPAETEAPEDSVDPEESPPPRGIWGMTIGEGGSEAPEPKVYDFESYPEPGPFVRGINMGNCLEAPNEGAWGITIREEYFDFIKEAGFDHVRIPIRWNAHADYSAPYTIRPRFFNRVDEVVNQALSRGLTAVINIHHYDGLMHDPPGHKDRFLALWHQIGERYRDYPEGLYFEILNEPMGRMSSTLWNEYLAEALAVIRETNPTRQVVIGPANWNNLNQLNFLEWPEDENVIITFHYYNPFNFTHQGAEWVNNAPPVGRYWGSAEEISAIERDMDRAAAFARRHNVTVWIGEFGAYSTADMESRVRWTETVTRAAEERGLAWAYWEFGAGFGAYSRTQRRWIPELLDALIPPEDRE